jgi:phosphate transport system permease protein
MKIRKHWRRAKNHAGKFACGFGLMLVLYPLGSILYHLLKRGLPGLSLDFFISSPKPLGVPGSGIGNALLGSFMIVTMSAFIAVPWGVFLGVILSQYSKKKWVRFLRYTVDLQLSLPSIVVGIFAYAVLVEPFRKFSAHSGAAALSILLLPVVARTTEEGLRALPIQIKEAALALGIPTWRVHINILLRAIRPIVMAGIFLGLARIAGETAPLLFTAFSSSRWPIDWQEGSQLPSFHLTEPISTLPVQIFQYASSGFDEWRQKAWTGAMVLVFWIMLVNIATKTYFNKGAKG